MCGGVLFEHEGQEHKYYFPNPKAVLPVKTKQGGMGLVTWGRRRHESGNLPTGGWARHESIKKGVWDRYFPKAVKLGINSFMEKDIEGTSHWFPVVDGQYIQGLLAQYDTELRIYVVTITPEREDAVHDRWPRILTAD